MKKRTLLVLALTALTFPTFASMQATGWAWINDDGDASTATFMAAEDVTPVTISNDQVVRLRIRFDDMYDGGKTTTSLKYFTAPLPATNINGDDARLIELGPGAFFDWANSSFVSDGTPIETRNITYNSIKDGDFQDIFVPGIFVSSAQPFTVPAYSSSEIEYCIKPTSNVVPGTYYFMPGGGEACIYPEATNLETFPELTVLSTAVQKVKVAEVGVVSNEGSIQLSSLSRGSVSVALVNALGQKVKSVSAETADGQLTISTSGLAQGMYMVQINGVTSKKVIIK